MSVEEYVKNWFSNKCGMGEEITQYLDENYLESGFIDSFGFLELITNCEENLHVSLSSDDFANDKIFTINGLIAILSEKIGG